MSAPSPFYIPPILSASMAALTVFRLVLCTRERISDKTFRRIESAYAVLAFGGGGIFTVAMFVRVSKEISADEACAFLIQCSLLGIGLGIWAGFGFFAWNFQSRWQRFTQRMEQLKRQRQPRKETPS